MIVLPFPSLLLFCLIALSPVSVDSSDNVGVLVSFGGSGGSVYSSGQDHENCGYLKWGGCLFCRDGYELTPTGKCVPTARCLRYDQNKMCLQCLDALWLEEGDCIDSNCLAGPSSFKCSACKPGHQKNEIGICIVPNCVDFRAGFCFHCQQGTSSQYGLCPLDHQPWDALIIIRSSQWSQSWSSSVYTTTITQIISTVTTPTAPANIGVFSPLAMTIRIDVRGCLSINWRGQCLSCYPPYVLDNISCLDLNPICALFSTTNGTCLKDAQNNLKINGDCLQRSDGGCLKCQSDGGCLKCQSEYTLVDNQCIVLAAQQGCVEGFYQNEGSCARVQPTCRTYGQAGECFSCFQGYSLQGNSCLIDLGFNPIRNCVGFEHELGTCLRCREGYFRHSRGLCVQVLPGCMVFQMDTGQCLVCYMGFYLIDGSCRVVVPALNTQFCIDYDPADPRVCSRCMHGYLLKLNECHPSVQYSCSEYDASSGVCVWCGKPLVMWQGHCVSGPNIQVLSPLCAIYNGYGVCEKCEESYSMVNHFCMRQ